MYDPHVFRETNRFGDDGVVSLAAKFDVLPNLESLYLGNALLEIL